MKSHFLQGMWNNAKGAGKPPLWSQFSYWQRILIFNYACSYEQYLFSLLFQLITQMFASVKIKT